jgi:hypothetical protein
VMTDSAEPAHRFALALDAVVAAALSAQHIAGQWADEQRQLAEAGLGLEAGDPTALDDVGYSAALDLFADVDRLLGSAERLRARISPQLPPPGGTGSSNQNLETGSRPSADACPHCGATQDVPLAAGLGCTNPWHDGERPDGERPGLGLDDLLERVWVAGRETPLRRTDRTLRWHVADVHGVKAHLHDRGQMVELHARLHAGYLHGEPGHEEDDWSNRSEGPDSTPTTVVASPSPGPAGPRGADGATGLAAVSAVPRRPVVPSIATPGGSGAEPTTGAVAKPTSGGAARVGASPGPLPGHPRKED